MKELKRIEFEKVILIVIFCIMLLANHMSPLAFDDFEFAFSLATGERITNFIDLISSVKAFNINGRVIACFVIQLCLIFPKAIFNIVNSLVFVFQLILIRRLCCIEGTKNWRIILGAVGLIWYFIPAFGEDYLWLCAAVLYSWGATLSLFYTLCFGRYMHGMKSYSIGMQIGICLTAFLLGAYSETTSVVAVAVPVIYGITFKFIYNKQIKLWMILSEIFADIGFLMLVCNPAEHMKMAEPSLKKYLTNLEALIYRYVSAFKILLVIFAIFVVVVFIKMKLDKKEYSIEKFIDSAIYMLISLGISGAMIFTSVYPLRVMLLTGLFLFIAFLSFLYEARDIIQFNKLHWRICGIATGIVIICIMADGVYEVCDYGVKISRIHVDIQDQIKRGKTEIVIPECPDYGSKYIVYNERAYLFENTEQNIPFMRYMKYDATLRVEEEN